MRSRQGGKREKVERREEIKVRNEVAINNQALPKVLTNMSLKGKGNLEEVANPTHVPFLNTMVEKYKCGKKCRCCYSKKFSQHLQGT